MGTTSISGQETTSCPSASIRAASGPACPRGRVTMIFTAGRAGRSADPSQTPTHPGTTKVPAAARRPCDDLVPIGSRDCALRLNAALDLGDGLLGRLRPVVEKGHVPRPELQLALRLLAGLLLRMQAARDDQILDRVALDVSRARQPEREKPRDGRLSRPRDAAHQHDPLHAGTTASSSRA